MAGIRIDCLETEIRHRVKEVGGKWNPAQKLWELPLSTIFDIALEKIVFKEDKKASMVDNMLGA